MSNKGLVYGFKPQSPIIQRDFHVDQLQLKYLLSYNLGEKVDSSNTSFKNGIAALVLSRCRHGNAGTYTCTVENTAGKQSSSAVLHVTGKVSCWRSLTNIKCSTTRPLNEPSSNGSLYSVSKGRAIKEIPRTSNHEKQREVAAEVASRKNTQLPPASKGKSQHREKKDEGRFNFVKPYKNIFFIIITHPLALHSLCFSFYNK